jgi:hypothetical protein
MIEKCDGVHETCDACGVRANRDDKTTLVTVTYSKNPFGADDTDTVRLCDNHLEDAKQRYEVNCLDLKYPL